MFVAGHYKYPESLFVDYVNESEHLAGFKDNRTNMQGGEIQAIHEAVTLGDKGTPLTLDHFIRWQNLILEEYKILGKPIEQKTMSIDKKGALMKIVAEINERCGSDDAPMVGKDKVQFLSKLYCELTNLDAFPYVNDALTRMIINYVNSRFFSPICVFKLSEQNELTRAGKDILEAQLYFAKKVKEAAFDQGFYYMKFVGNSGDSFEYRNESGSKLIIEWHDLNSWAETLKPEK